MPIALATSTAASPLKPSGNLPEGFFFPRPPPLPSGLFPESCRSFAFRFGNFFDCLPVKHFPKVLGSVFHFPRCCSAVFLLPLHADSFGDFLDCFPIKHFGQLGLSVSRFPRCRLAMFLLPFLRIPNALQCSSFAVSPARFAICAVLLPFHEVSHRLARSPRPGRCTAKGPRSPACRC